MKNILLIIILMASQVTMERPMNNKNPDSKMIQGQNNLNKTLSSNYDPSVQIHKEASEDDWKETEDFLKWLKVTNNSNTDVCSTVSIQEYFVEYESKRFPIPFSDYSIDNFGILLSCSSHWIFDDYNRGFPQNPSLYANLNLPHWIIYEKRQSFFELYKKSMADKEIEKFCQENSNHMFKLLKVFDVRCVNYFIQNITRLKQWKILCELNIPRNNVELLSVFFRDSPMMEAFETFLTNLEDEECSKNLMREDCKKHFDILLRDYRNVDLFNFFFQKEMNLEYFTLIEHDWDFIAVADHALKPQGRINLKRAVDYIIKNTNSFLVLQSREHHLFIIKSVISENVSLMEFILNMTIEDWILFDKFLYNCKQKELLQRTILYKNNQLLKEIIEEQRAIDIESSSQQNSQNSINCYQTLFNQDVNKCYFWIKERNGLVIFKQLFLAKIDHQLMDKFSHYHEGQSMIEQLINYFNTEIVSDMDKKIEEINECLKFLSVFIFHKGKINDFKASLTPYNVKTMFLACLEFRLIKNFNLFPWNKILSFPNSNSTQSIKKEEELLMARLRKTAIKFYKTKRDPSVSLLKNVTYNQNIWDESYRNSFSLWNKLGSINGIWQEILKNIQRTKNYSFLNNIKRLFKRTQSPVVWNYLLEDNPEFLLMVMDKYNVGNFIENFLKDGNSNKKKMFKDFMALLIEEFKSNPNKREQVSFHVLTMGPWVDPKAVDTKKNPYNQVFFDGLCALNDWNFIGEILSSGFQGLQRFSLVFFLMGSMFNKNSTIKVSKISKFYRTNMKEFLKNKKNSNGLKFFFNQINGDDDKYNFLLENSHENIGWLLNLEITVMNYCFQRMDKVVSMVKKKSEKDEITMEELIDFNEITHGWNGFYNCLIEVFGKQSDDFFFSFFDMIFSSDLIDDKIFTIIRSHKGMPLAHHQHQTNPITRDQGQQNLKQQLIDELSFYQPLKSLARQQYVEIPKSSLFYNKNLQDQLMEEDFEQSSRCPWAVDNDYDVDSPFRKKAQKDSSIIDQTFYNHERLMTQSNNLAHLNASTYEFAMEELTSLIFNDENKLIVEDKNNSTEKKFSQMNIFKEKEEDTEIAKEEKLEFLQSESDWDDDSVIEIESDDEGENVEDNININESNSNNSMDSNGNILQPTGHGTLENTTGGGLMVGSGSIVSTRINTGLKRKPSTQLEEPPLKKIPKTEGLKEATSQPTNEDLNKSTSELLGLFDKIKDIIKDENSDPVFVEIAKHVFESVNKMNTKELLILKIKNYQDILDSINTTKQLEMEKIYKETEKESSSQKQVLVKQEQLLEKTLDEMVNLLNEVNTIIEANKIILKDIPPLFLNKFVNFMDSLINGVYENFIGVLTFNIKINHDVNFIKEKFYGIFQTNIENLKPYKQKSDNSIAIAIEAVRKEVDENPKLKTFHISKDYQNFKIQGMDPLEVSKYYNLGNENNRLAKVAIEQARQDLQQYYCANEKESIDLSWINCSDKIQQVKQTLKTSIDCLKTLSEQQCSYDPLLSFWIMEQQSIDLSWIRCSYTIQHIIDTLKTRIDSIKTLFTQESSNDRLVFLTFLQRGLMPFGFYPPKITSLLKEKKILENKTKEKIAERIQDLLRGTVIELIIGVSLCLCEAQMNQQGYILMNNIIRETVIQNNDYLFTDKKKFTFNNLFFFVIKTIMLNLKKFSKVNLEYKEVLELLSPRFRFYHTRLEPRKDGN